MLRWQLAEAGRRVTGPQCLGAYIRLLSNRKFPELETLQLVENIERHSVLIANFRGSR
jgi:hypothetical protein